MRLRMRESGFSTLTLERPALSRDAQSNMVERIAPWLRRSRQQVEQHMRSAADAAGSWGVRIAAHVRQMIALLRERAVPWLGQARLNLGERLRSAIQTSTPKLVRARVQVRESTRTFAATAAPRLQSARERLEERTVSAVDSVRPWLAQGRKRIAAFREAANAKRKAGVPIWATVLLVVVAALVAQALAHRSVEGRHELQTRQLTQIHKTELASAQARAADALIRESEEVHRLLGATIAWTIASALTRKKDNELELYFHELTKNEHIDLVVFADPKGKVMLASDGRLKGADFGQHFPATLLQETAVSIHRGTNATNRLVMPVHRSGARLGTAMLVYKAR
jgi:hypothetical protein